MVIVCPSPHRAPMIAACKHRPLAADDGGDGHDVIGIGGMTHPQKQSQQNDGE